MSITSFSKPSDADVLSNVDTKGKVLGFVDEGMVLQNADETRYVRMVKIKLDEEEVVQNIVYIKTGTDWVFKKTETIAVISHP